MPEAASLISEEIREEIGIEWEPHAVEVDKRWIRSYAQAVGDPNPLWQDEAAARKTPYGGITAPPTFYDALDPNRSYGEPRPRWKILASQKGFVRGSDEVEFFEPLRPGDTITASARIVDVSERPGRSGRLLLVRREVVYTNQFGEVVVKNRNTLIWVF